MSRSWMLSSLCAWAVLLTSCTSSGGAPTTVSTSSEVVNRLKIEPPQKPACVALTSPDSTVFENTITDPNHTLVPIYEKLYRLKMTSDTTTLSIVHIGDSHLQAGFLNGTVMKLLQQEFGNAGRGLIIPLKLARTNEPTDYFIESNATWDVARCVTQRVLFPTGLGGLSIMTKQPDFRFRVGTKEQGEIDYSFDRIKIFHHPKAPAMRNVSQGCISSTRSPKAPFVTQLNLKQAVHSLDILSETAQPGDSSIIYGFSLERSRPGVIYHAIGINAAQFSSYLRVEDFSEQIRALSPDLIIFSLGTNEAFNNVINKRTFTGNVNRLISSLATQVPQSKILVSTPAECQRRYPKYNNEFRPNELIPQVSEALADYATANGYPLWDLYRITGGKNSSQWWIKNEYLAKDRVHFYPSGYKYQGALLYHALINGYNSYVSTRLQ